MVDATLIWTDRGADIEFGAADVRSDAGLPNAVLISLFTDGRARLDDELPFGETRRRGHWPDNEEFRIGSLLWLISREKLLNETAERARVYCQDALAWLVNDGIAAQVDVETEIIKPTNLLIRIDLTRSSDRRFDYLWEDVRGIQRDLYLGENLLTLDIQLD